MKVQAATRFFFFVWVVQQKQRETREALFSRRRQTDWPTASQAVTGRRTAAPRLWRASGASRWQSLSSAAPPPEFWRAGRDPERGTCAGRWCAHACLWILHQCPCCFLPPPKPPPAPRSLSSYYSHSALEGRQRSLNALCCLLHCLCCFSVPVPHSLPIFVFINHNGRLPQVS